MSDHINVKWGGRQIEMFQLADEPGVFVVQLSYDILLTVKAELHRRYALARLDVELDVPRGHSLPPSRVYNATASLEEDETVQVALDALYGLLLLEADSMKRALG